MRRRIDPELTKRARELRNNPTPAELAVWHRVSRCRPAFTRQLVVPPFIIDLACRKAKLGIEFDGSQHLDSVTADARRTAYWSARAGGSSGCGTRMSWPVPTVPRSTFCRKPPNASAAPTPSPSLPGRGEGVRRDPAECPLTTNSRRCLKCRISPDTLATALSHRESATMCRNARPSAVYARGDDVCSFAYFGRLVARHFRPHLLSAERR